MAAVMDNLLAGLLAGATSTAVLQPIDVVKVRYQVWSKAYSSVPGALSSIVREEGFRALYKGLTPAMLGSSVSWGLYLHLYERAKAAVAQHRHSDGSRLSYWENMLAATSAGCSVVLVTNPIWMIKTRMQLQREAAQSGSGKAPYRGIVDAVRTIVKEEGCRALYRGIIPAFLLTSHGAIQFGIYEELKHYIPADRETPWGMMSTFAIGSASKLVAASATYPYQVIKSRMQQRSESSLPPYRGFRDCCTKLFREGGLRIFYSGFTANVIRVVPSGAITLMVFERLRPLFRDAFGTQSAAAQDGAAS